MKNLRSNFERFCFRNRNKGIPNLMFYVSIGTAIVYVMTVMSKDATLYNLLYFNRDLILRGQVWRLITYPLTTYQPNILLQLISLLCYHSLGRAMENQWGTFKFNLFYFSGILLMDIYGMVFNCMADVYYLNMSLFLGYATMYPNAHFLLFMIIPVKAWIFALLDLVIVFSGLFYDVFPYNLFPIIALANYFLFFGRDVLNVIPLTWRLNARRLFKKSKGTPVKQQPKIIRFDAGSYEASVATPKAPYTHRCTICGRTDISDPDLEFRYCSRCQGYHCYCEDHISNHTHIQ